MTENVFFETTKIVSQFVKEIVCCPENAITVEGFIWWLHFKGIIHRFGK